jgi:hypothetical protein
MDVFDFRVVYNRGKYQNCFGDDQRCITDLSETVNDTVDWIHLAQVRDQWRALVVTVIGEI